MKEALESLWGLRNGKWRFGLHQTKLAPFCKTLDLRLMASCENVPVLASLIAPCLHMQSFIARHKVRPEAARRTNTHFEPNEVCLVV